MTTTMTTTTQRVYDYATGEYVGRVSLTPERVAAYEAVAQQPQGIVAAGDVLTPAELSQLGLSAGQTIWIE